MTIVNANSKNNEIVIKLGHYVSIKEILESGKSFMHKELTIKF